MKYMLLIHQGSTPTPRDAEAWATLSEEQQQVFADYQAINQTPGVTPGQQLDEPATATTVRVQDGKTLTTDGPFVELKEAIGGYLFFEADDLDARSSWPRGSRPPVWAARSRCGPSRSGSDPRGRLPREWGFVLAALIGFLGDSTSPRKPRRRRSRSRPSGGRARAAPNPRRG